ncbi:MAG TPA: Bax inhibitor-1/YccA family protein [Amaricoccus sp.]|jgi:FtsH-binding integral membrane protein|nr:Bax inhibitor-1/YccA family protein [Amaricoccus sp.]
MAEFETVRQAGAGARTVRIDEGLRAHMNKVYGLMAVAMLITGAAAWAIAGLAVSDVPTAYQVGPDTWLTGFGAAIYTSPLRWVVMLLPLAFVFGLSAGVSRMSTATAQLVFYAFAVAMGVSISSIFLVFTNASIAQVFLITAIAFAALSLWGYTTRKDISGWGSFLFMGVIGLIVAMLVNLWLASPALEFAVSAIGVLIFAALTAYDTQNIKNQYLQLRGAQGEAYLGHAAILGALSLYLNFINMFMMLLSLFGQRE